MQHGGGKSKIYDGALSFNGFAKLSIIAVFFLSNL
jgi:hypothetical protein